MLILHIVRFSEAAAGGILQKKMFLKILQYSQENTCARVSFLIKLQASGPLLYSKSDIFRWIVQNFQKYFFLQNSSGRLLLNFCELLYR